MSNDVKVSNNVVHAFGPGPWMSFCIIPNTIFFCLFLFFVFFIILIDVNVCWTSIQGHAQTCSRPGSVLPHKAYIMLFRHGDAVAMPVTTLCEYQLKVSQACAIHAKVQSTGAEETFYGGFHKWGQ